MAQAGTQPRVEPGAALPGAIPGGFLPNVPHERQVSILAAANDCIPRSRHLPNCSRVDPQIDDRVGPVSPGQRAW